jgi:hypothetical protein
LETNPAFRMTRIQKECGPITALDFMLSESIESYVNELLAG